MIRLAVWTFAGIATLLGGWVLLVAAWTQPLHRGYRE